MLGAPKTVLALFDVLGFEDRLRSDGLPRLVDAYRELAAVVRKRRDCLIIDAMAEARELDDGSVLSVPAIGVLVVEQAFFSDTIVLWAIFDRARFWTFCDICAEFFCTVLHLGMPLRGGIAVGDAHMDRRTKTYLGYPLVEAARVEKAQRWIGVSFGPSFTGDPFRRYLRPDQTMYFTEHRKADADAGQFIPGVVLDWPRKWRKVFRESPCRHLAQLNRKPPYDSYYRTSIRFAELSDQREKDGG